MFSSMQVRPRYSEDFTLIELMIVVALIGLLAAVAVPNFIAYRDRAQVAAAKTSMESVRAALATYSASDQVNVYPRRTSWAIMQRCRRFPLTMVLISQLFQGLRELQRLPTAQMALPTALKLLPRLLPL